MLAARDFSPRNSRRHFCARKSTARCTRSRTCPDRHCREGLVLDSHPPARGSARCPRPAPWLQQHRGPARARALRDRLREAPPGAGSRSPGPDLQHPAAARQRGTRASPRSPSAKSTRPCPAVAGLQQAREAGLAGTRAAHRDLPARLWRRAPSAVEARSCRPGRCAGLLDRINDRRVVRRRAVSPERELLAVVDGSCKTPICRLRPRARRAGRCA
jgi:hypothetical protein